MNRGESRSASDGDGVLIEQMISRIHEARRREVRDLIVSETKLLTIETATAFRDYQIELLYRALFPSNPSKRPRAYCILGAGISTAVGVSAFRSTGSIFRRAQKFYPLLVQSIKEDKELGAYDDSFLRYALGLRGIRRNPVVTYRILHDYQKSLRFVNGVLPSLAHNFLYFLSVEGILDLVLTQNLDEIEQIMGLDEVATVQFVHGLLSNDGCCLECGTKCPSCIVQAAIADGSVPSCEQCGMAIKPGLVCYDENVKLTADAVARIANPDNPYTLGLIMGTNLLVAPVSLVPGVAPLSSQIHIICKHFNETSWPSSNGLDFIRTGRLRQLSQKVTVAETDQTFMFSPMLNIISDMCDTVIQKLLCRSKYVASKFLKTMQKIAPDILQRGQQVDGFSNKPQGPYCKVYLAVPHLMPPDGHVQCIKFGTIPVFCLLTVMTEATIRRHFRNQKAYEVYPLGPLKSEEVGSMGIVCTKSLLIISLPYKQVLSCSREETMAFLQKVVYRPLRCHWGYYLCGYNRYRLIPPSFQYVEELDPWNAFFFSAGPPSSRNGFCYTGMPTVSLALQEQQEHAIYVQFTSSSYFCATQQ